MAQGVGECQSALRSRSPESPTGKGRGGALLQTLDTLDLPGGPTSAANQEKRVRTQAGGPGSAQQLFVLALQPSFLSYAPGCDGVRH